MTPEFLRSLRARRATISARWETLLRLERVSGPLANPDALVHLVPHSLDRIFHMLVKPLRGPVSLLAAKARVPECECGNNPYRAYFIAGEQALMESVVLLQAEQIPAERHPRDVAEMLHATRKLACDEIDTFCGVCEHRCTAPKCRHALANAQSTERALTITPAVRAG